jgi:hypothetical protein
MSILATEYTLPQFIEAVVLLFKPSNWRLSKASPQHDAVPVFQGNEIVLKQAEHFLHINLK